MSRGLFPLDLRGFASVWDRSPAESPWATGHILGLKVVLIRDLRPDAAEMAVLRHLRQLLSTKSGAAPRVIARVDGNPVLINNLARFYYDARPLDAIGPREGGDGDLTGFRMWEAAPHLIHYLRHHRSLVQGRSVIDLGGGVWRRRACSCGLRCYTCCAL